MAGRKSTQATLQLSAVLDLNEASVLRGKLMELRGSALAIDASAVERVGVQCVQVLMAGIKTWETDGKGNHIRESIGCFCKNAPIDRRQHRSSAPEGDTAMKKKVLTVDDSRTIRNMLLVTLNNAGFETVQAEDGVEGLEVLEQSNPDVIVTDINMPRLDGFGFIEGVRRNEKFRAVPILVLTTESDAEKKNRARQAGATGWIVKPFDPAKLIDAIERVTA